MQTHEARVASFWAGQRRAQWPHPASFRATPASLAAAGFFFNPSTAAPDAVSCFLCDKGLAHWDPDDDPAQIHSEKCPACPWAVLKCAPANPARSATRAVEHARLATFGPWWPHDAKKRGPSAKMMAKAGFIYAPVDPGDDTCACIYCGIELAGWEPHDDPMEEHRSRQAKTGPCPFFAPEPATRARSKSKPPSDQESHPPAASTSARPKTKPPKKAPKPKKTEVVAEYHVPVDDDAPPKPRPKSRRTTSRSRSRSRSRASSRSTAANDTVANDTAANDTADPPDPPDILSPPPKTPAPPPHSPLKSFQSPEDQEFAREEQALDEQARQLMLADGTLSPASRHALAENHTPAEPSPPTLDKGKRKADAPPPSTPPRSPPRTPPEVVPPSVVTFPQLLPQDSVLALTDAERAMTVEQWVRHEMDRQYERLKSDGRQKIDAFIARAVEVAKEIERL